MDELPASAELSGQTAAVRLGCQANSRASALHAAAGLAHYQGKLLILLRNTKSDRAALAISSLDEGHGQGAIARGNSVTVGCLKTDIIVRGAGDRRLGQRILNRQRQGQEDLAPW